MHALKSTNTAKHMQKKKKSNKKKITLNAITKKKYTDKKSGSHNIETIKQPPHTHIKQTTENKKQKQKTKNKKPKNKTIKQ